MVPLSILLLLFGQGLSYTGATTDGEFQFPCTVFQSEGNYAKAKVPSIIGIADFDRLGIAFLDCTLCVADMDGDGDTDSADFAEWLVCFDGHPSCSPMQEVCADLDFNGRIDLGDFVIFASYFGTECE
jgi:hypothetical protein